MEKMQKRSKPVTLLISLLGSWIVTAVLLVLLAAAMMKFQLEEGKISAAVTVIYLGSAFFGRKDRRQKDGEQKIPVGVARRNVLFCSAFSSDTDPETEHRSVFHTDDNDSLSVHGRRNVRRNACFLKAFRVKVRIDF